MLGEDQHSSVEAPPRTFKLGKANDSSRGPLSDRFGRRITYGLSSVTFLGTTLGCAFSPNISVLVAMRALQGFAECAYLTNGQAVVADIFAPAQRGQALGVFMLSLVSARV
uniref:Major facilitator superfamily (MFS) profile domain-containing protein n=1 Tax=Tetradesmus obliquus TaxID=3088 RepID=A0A383VVY5_TETOB|eukprot:jgi/Sobl393_1/14409/SZX69371.1